MTSNTSSPLTQCTSGDHCKTEELCALDWNTNSYKCQSRTSVSTNTWIVYNDTSSPQWYPPEDRKAYGQTCQHHPPSPNVDDYYGNCQEGLFCDKGSNTCMNQFDGDSSCVSDNQCVSKNCNNMICDSLMISSISKNQYIVIAVTLGMLVMVGIIVLLVNKMRQGRKGEKRLSNDSYEEGTQRLSNGNASTLKTSSFITINGESITDGPYFDDQSIINASYSLPLYRGESILFSDVQMSGLLTNQESRERRNTFSVLPILTIPQTFQQRESGSGVTAVSEKRTSRSTIHSHHSLNNERSQLGSMNDSFDEFPPPAY